VGGVYPWRGRGWLELTGRDRASFLHAFCTQEIKKLAPGDIREAFFCAGNGKIVGHGFVVVEPDRLLIATPRDHVAPLLRHLDRFVIREDVRLADRSGTMAAALFCGLAGIGLRQAIDLPSAAPAAPYAASSAALSAMLSTALSAQLAGSVVVRSNPWDSSDAALWVEYPAPDATASDSDQWLEKLRSIAVEGLLRAAGGSIQAAVASESPARETLTGETLIREALAIWDERTFESWRIAHGAPLYGREITAEQLPQEVGRDARAISFNKGCYLGQEPVARIDALGHVNWELVTFQIAASAAADGSSAVGGSAVGGSADGSGADGSSADGSSADGGSAGGAGAVEYVAGATLAIDGKPALRIATILPWVEPSGGLARITAAFPVVAPSPASATTPVRWTHAGLGYVRREARRSARASAEPTAEGVLATSAGVVRIEPRPFFG
jgi:folate-binding protein YgfZ